MKILEGLYHYTSWMWEIQSRSLDLGKAIFKKTVKIAMMVGPLLAVLWKMNARLLDTIGAKLSLLRGDLGTVVDGINSVSGSSAMSQWSSVTDFVGVINQVFPLDEVLVMIIVLFNLWLITALLKISVFVYDKTIKLLHIGVNAIRG